MGIFASLFLARKAKGTFDSLMCRNDDRRKWVMVHIYDKTTHQLLASALVPPQSNVKAFQALVGQYKNITIRYERWTKLPNHSLIDIHKAISHPSPVVHHYCPNSQVYVDHDFPPHDRSISEKKVSFKTKWRKIQEIYPQVTYGETFSHKDVIQGQTGDCWLMSALICLTEKPDLLKSLLQRFEDNRFQIRLWKSGELFDVHIDDMIPCYEDDGQPVFCHTRSRDAWAILFEKAYAKVYGEYTKLDGGFPMESLSELTGCPSISETLDTVTKRSKRQAVWTKIRNAHKAGHLVVTGTYPHSYWTVKKRKNEREDGFVAAHAYAVIRITEDEIILRNPWGWLIPNVARTLNSDDEEEPSEFGLNFSQYWEFFRSLTICYHQKYQEFRYRTIFCLKPQQEIAIKNTARLTLPDDATVFFSAYQANEYEKNSTTKLPPMSLGFTISSATQPDNSLKTSSFEEKHQISSQQNLKSGSYLFELATESTSHNIFNVEDITARECKQEIFNVMDTTLQKTISEKQLKQFFKEIDSLTLVEDKIKNIYQNYESLQKKLTFDGFTEFWDTLTSDESIAKQLRQKLLYKGQFCYKAITCVIQSTIDDFHVEII